MTNEASAPVSRARSIVVFTGARHMEYIDKYDSSNVRDGTWSLCMHAHPQGLRCAVVPLHLRTYGPVRTKEGSIPSWPRTHHARQLSPIGDRSIDRRKKVSFLTEHAQQPIAALRRGRFGPANNVLARPATAVGKQKARSIAPPSSTRSRRAWITHARTYRSRASALASRAVGRQADRSGSGW